jgi:hypothetical protein
VIRGVEILKRINRSFCFGIVRIELQGCPKLFFAIFKIPGAAVVQLRIKT